MQYVFVFGVCRAPMRACVCACMCGYIDIKTTECAYVCYPFGTPAMMTILSNMLWCVNNHL